MAVTITPAVQNFLTNEKVLITVVTLMKDGSPQATPVWVDTDGKHIVINTAEGRVKMRNLKRDARVAFTVLDPANTQGRAVWGRGRVVAMTRDGANEHINKLSAKYVGRSYPLRDSEVRVKVLIEPISLTARGF